MPVTVRTASHKSNEVRSLKTESAEALLQGSCSNEHRACKVLLQSSIDLTSPDPLYSARNGFVSAAVQAYSSHHHLIIRPEDVWIAILTQFSIYVNAHAEELRGKFVSFQGKKELEIKEFGNRWTVDFGALAQRMSYLLEQNVVDEELREWIIPAFSTTTDNDEMVAAVIMMSTLQKYFDYKFTFMCGLPSVTLLGELADWEKLLEKIEKLKTFGHEPSMWYQLLNPVLNGFIKTFTGPRSKQVTAFWSRIAHRESMGSGASYYSGWITAFCFWAEDGKMLYNPPSPVNQRNRDGRPTEQPLVDKIWRSSVISSSSAVSAKSNSFRYSKPKSAAAVDGDPIFPDNVTYHRVNTNNVPAGYTSVPVKIDDNGHVFMATMIAGSVGMRGSSRGQDSAPQPRGYEHRKEDKQEEEEAAGKTVIDTLQPEVGWFIFERKPEDEVKKLFSFSRY